MDLSEPNSSPTLLIVDDSVADRAAFRRFLTRGSTLNYQILEVASAEEGLALLAETPVDLILLDYGLPGLNGLAFLQQLSTATTQQPSVLMLTGQGDERIATQAIKLGAHDYIVKQPNMGDVLRLAVRTALKEAALQSRVATYQAQQALIQDIALRIRQSLDLQEILAQAALEIRSLLMCDRVLLYRFLPDKSGLVEVESVSDRWPMIKGESIEDSCFQNGWIDIYLDGQTTTIDNVLTSDGMTECHRQLLRRFQVQANMVVPIVISPPSSLTASADPNPFQIGGKTLWGLLIAHQCDAPRHWQPLEIQLLQQLSNQLAIALQQSVLYQQLQLANQQLEAQVAVRTADLQQANTNLQHLNQALNASNQDLEQFAYIASHDLREPLRKIKSFAELLAKRYQGDLDETGDRYISYITGGAVRMQSLINDLLTYSRLGRHDLERVSTDLNHVLVQVLGTLSEQIQEKRAVVKAKPLPVLPVDAVQIEQLLRNLIENALKYSGDAPPKIVITAEYIESADRVLEPNLLPAREMAVNEIAVSESSAGESSAGESSAGETVASLSGGQNAVWKISVADNGIGIEPEFYERIFAIFQRLHSKSAYSGTGIGLAICQKIVDRHGGKLGVYSTPTQGSTFWFTLPSV